MPSKEQWWVKIGGLAGAKSSGKGAGSLHRSRPSFFAGSVDAGSVGAGVPP